MRVLVVASLLASYANAQTCGDASISCDNDMLIDSGKACDDTSGGTACNITNCCTVAPVPTCGNMTGLQGGSPFGDCGSLTRKDDMACGSGGCDKATCCTPGPLTCQDSDGLGDGNVYNNCGVHVVLDVACDPSGCTNAKCCTQGEIKCSDKDGLNGGNFDCTPPMKFGGGDITDDSACVNTSDEGCTDAECCSAGDATCKNTTGMPGGPEYVGCGVHAVLDVACSGSCDNATCCTQGEIKCSDKDGLNGGNFDCPIPMVFGQGTIQDDSACTSDPCTNEECCGAAAATCGNTTGMPSGVAFDCGDLTAQATSTACTTGADCDKATCCVPGDITCADKDGLGGGAYECTGENMVAGGGSLDAGAACSADPCTDAECCSEAEPQDDDSEAGRVMPVVVTAFMVAMAIF